MLLSLVIGMGGAGSDIDAARARVPVEADPIYEQVGAGGGGSETLHAELEELGCE